jgi:hypothetical protein
LAEAKTVDAIARVGIWLPVAVLAVLLFVVLPIYLLVRWRNLPFGAQALLVFLPLSLLLTVVLLEYVWNEGWLGGHPVPYGTLLLFSPSLVCLVGGAIALTYGLGRRISLCTWAGLAGLAVGGVEGVLLLGLIALGGMGSTAFGGP